MFFVTFVVHVIFVLLAAVPAGAQTNQQILQGGSPLPPRDARPAAPTATGTAAIRGRVFAADGKEITPRIEAEYDKRVYRVQYRGN